MVGHDGSNAGSYLDDPTSPIPSHCASIVMSSTLRVNKYKNAYRLIMWTPAPCTVQYTQFMEQHIQNPKNLGGIW